jgi:DNA-binding HxlR family transcriptional regulator
MKNDGLLLKLIQTKGIAEIFSQIQYSPKKYNSLKKNLKTEISARTLDHRLQDLREKGFICQM